jgi:lysophospholipase L1-like esterase
MHSMRSIVSLLFAAAIASASLAQDLESKPALPHFEKFEPKKAPAPKGLLLKKGDRLAICGDSITEQKMYSRIIETYLTVAVPELDITARQYGWSGETAPGFLARMTNDCLRFKPTIATTCYGMNDHGYRPYEPAIGERYKSAQAAIVEAFKHIGARVVLGSAGCVGKIPAWTKSDAYTVDQLNLNLCELRNIDIGIAQNENVAFADVFWPMFTQDYYAREKYGKDYAVAGKDGVHPGWAGQLVIAYAFLKGLGLEGEIGTYTIDLAHNKATVSKGHELLSYKDGVAEIKSARYPFCAAGGDMTKDDNIRSGMTLVAFNQELNRLMLVVKNPSAQNYKVTWGSATKSFSSEQLSKGVNLAAEFETNPFSDPFKKVDEAVAAKQNYETRQIKDLFHGPEGHADKDMTADLTEKARAPLEKKIHESFVPVTHTLTIAPE